MTTNFLPNRVSIFSEYEGLIKRSPTLRIAIAFWGLGAAKQLGLLESKAETRVLCWLSSGGTNPAEIKTLINYYGAESVRQLDNMHAKVICGEDRAIIASANASADGLGWEGSETDGHFEAGVLVRDPTVLRQIQQWFDTLWNNEATIIDRAALVSARSTHDARRKTRPVRGPQSLLLALRSSPDVFNHRPWYLVLAEAWSPPKRYEELFKQESKDLGINRKMDYWPNWRLKKNAYFVLFTWEARPIQRNRRLKRIMWNSGTIWATDSDPVRHRGKTVLSLVIQKTNIAKKYGFLPSEKDEWRDIIAHLPEKHRGKAIPLGNIAKYIAKQDAAKGQDS